MPGTSDGAEKLFDIKCTLEDLKQGKCCVTNGPLLNMICKVSTISYYMDN